MAVLDSQTSGVAAASPQGAAMGGASVASATGASYARPAARFSITNTLVRIAMALGLAAVVPGMLLGVYGLPLGVAAAAVSAAALIRLTNKPPEQRRGELLTLLSLGVGVFQLVFALVAFYFVNLG